MNARREQPNWIQTPRLGIAIPVNADLVDILIPRVQATDGRACDGDDVHGPDPDNVRGPSRRDDVMHVAPCPHKVPWLVPAPGLAVRNKRPVHLVREAKANTAPEGPDLTRKPPYIGVVFTLGDLCQPEGGLIESPLRCRRRPCHFQHGATGGKLLSPVDREVAQPGLARILPTDERLKYTSVQSGAVLPSG